MTIDSLLYFGAIALWSAFVAYMALERFAPRAKHETHHADPAPEHGANIAKFVPRAHVSHHTPRPIVHHVEHVPSVAATGFNPYEGFKSFQNGAELTVDDIVKGLSRNG